MCGLVFISYQPPQLNMASHSVCWYTANITSFLSTPVGARKFPQNPEFYELASDLYGPGSFYCWYLLGISAALKRDRRDNSLRVSADLYAVILYPVFAAFDLFIQTVRLWKTPGLAEAISCLQMDPFFMSREEEPSPELVEQLPFQVDLQNVPPEVLELGQKAIALLGPLVLCYTLTNSVVVYMYAMMGTGDPEEGREPTVTCSRAVSLLEATFGFVSILLVVFHFSLDRVGTSISIWWLEVGRQVLYMTGITMWSSVFLVWLPVLFIVQSFKKRAKENRDSEVNKPKRWYLRVAHACLRSLTITLSFVAGNRFSLYKLVPDVGVSVTEKGQLFTLMGGSLALAHSFYTFALERASTTEDMDVSVSEAVTLLRAEEGIEMEERNG